MENVWEVVWVRFRAFREHLNSAKIFNPMKRLDIQFSRLSRVIFPAYNKQLRTNYSIGQLLLRTRISWKILIFKIFDLIRSPFWLEIISNKYNGLISWV